MPILKASQQCGAFFCEVILARDLIGWESFGFNKKEQNQWRCSLNVLIALELAHYTFVIVLFQSQKPSGF
jgi:hypothetical protein